MGVINLNNTVNKDRLKFLTEILKKRGLYLHKKDIWQVHGPQSGMDYQVYVGPVYRRKNGQWLLVAIYPMAVYLIKDYSDWRNCKPENQIPAT